MCVSVCVFGEQNPFASYSPQTCARGCVHVAPSVLEADVVADLAGGSGSSLGQEEPPVGADADLVDALPGPGGGGGGGGRGLALGQPHQPDPAGVQGNLGRGRRQRRRVRKPVRPEPVETSQRIRFGDFLRLFQTILEDSGPGGAND